MSNTTKKVIKKSDWVSSFNLIGAAKITEHTFKIDEKSEKSSWIYNLLNLGIDCGEKFGTVFCEMMGGYSEEQAGLIYAHGKKKMVLMILRHRFRLLGKIDLMMRFLRQLAIYHFNCRT